MLEQNLEKKVENLEKQTEMEKKNESSNILDGIENLSPDEQIGRLVSFGLSEEKNAAEKAIEIASSLDNPNVLDEVRDKIAKEMDKLVSEKKIEEI